MKTFIYIAMLLSLSGCVSPQIVRPTVPDDFKSSYRRTQEVVLVFCTVQKSRTMEEPISIVEATDTGIRFELHGCYGKTGDRFRITY